MKNTVPTSQKYLKNCFPDLAFIWKDIYTLPHNVTVNTQLCTFPYKILNNVLYLKKYIFIFKKCDTNLFSFCNMEHETIIHLFTDCFKSKTWNSLKALGFLAFIILCLMFQQTNVSNNNILKFQLCQSLSQTPQSLKYVVSQLICKTLCRQHCYILP